MCFRSPIRLAKVKADETSRQLLSRLKVQQLRCEHEIVTVSELWRSLSLHHEMIELEVDEKVSEMERQTIQ
jgi:hypothetical protein